VVRRAPNGAECSRRRRSPASFVPRDSQNYSSIFVFVLLALSPKPTAAPSCAGNPLALIIAQEGGDPLLCGGICQNSDKHNQYIYIYKQNVQNTKSPMRGHIFFISAAFDKYHDY
jgi:hypothetical protein